jgi:hypothetical protein
MRVWPSSLNGPAGFQRRELPDFLRNRVILTLNPSQPIDGNSRVDKCRSAWGPVINTLYPSSSQGITTIESRSDDRRRGRYPAASMRLGFLITASQR